MFALADFTTEGVDLIHREPARTRVAHRVEQEGVHSTVGFTGDETARNTVGARPWFLPRNDAGGLDAFDDTVGD